MFKHQHLQIFYLKLNKFEYFDRLEVAGRDSETQHQVGQNIRKIT